MKKGFTLAEILITLAVIGIVATLTLPNLLMNYRQKVYIVQLQRAYNQLSTGLANMMAEENVDQMKDSTLVNRSGSKEFLSKYLKVSKNCGSGSECLSEVYEPVQRGSYYSYNQFLGYGNADCVMLNTGSTVCIQPFSMWNQYGIITLDTNGKGGPNINGRDFFTFYYYNDGSIGSVPTGTSYTYPIPYCSGMSYGCLGQIMADGWQMKY